MNSHSHEHPHSHHVGALAERALWVALALNGVYLAVELAVGLISDSLALLSDAGHMASDVAALGLALVAQRLARAQAGPAFTFGLRRVPVLGAFGNALSLVIIAVLILWEAWHRLLHPPEVMAGPVLVAGAIGLVINLVSAWYLHRSAEQSLNIRGAMLHLLADALGSVGAIAAAAIILITGWQPVDALVSVLIAVLLIASTWPLLRDSTKVLLQGAPAHLDLAAVARALEEEDEVLQASDLHVWQIDEGRTVLTGVLATDRSALPELEACALRIKHRLHEEYGIRHATLEWCSPGSAGTACTLS